MYVDQKQGQATKVPEVKKSKRPELSKFTHTIFGIVQKSQVYYANDISRVPIQHNQTIKQESIISTTDLQDAGLCVKVQLQMEQDDSIFTGFN